MKLIHYLLFVFLFGFFLTVISCAQRDIPQADVTTFVVVRADSIKEYVNSKYEYSFYDKEHRVVWVVYSDRRLNFKKDQTILGLIRK